MKRQLLLAISITSLAVTLGIFARFTWPPSDSQSSLDSGAGLTPARVAEVYGQLPLSFEANRGQAGGQVKFIARGRGYQLFLAATEAVLELPSASLRMKLSGANPDPQVEGLDQLSGKSHYFIGAEPQQWRANVPTYARVRYREVYPGVDLIYYGKQQQLEYDFVVAAGADPDVITLSFTGATELRLDEQGDLLLRTAGGELRQHKPIIWQETERGRQEVAGYYVIKDNGQVGFAVEDYDASHPLLIDPVLSYSTYFGGNNDDDGLAIAVDAAGSVYVTGETRSANFPTANPLQGTFSGGTCGTPAQPCSDVFIAKLNPAGTALIYSTYLGGGSNDTGNGIAVDSTGAVYVTGESESTNFPTTAGALQRTYGGNTFDGFIAKLNPSGSALVYSTYLGGSGNDFGKAIAVDAMGNAYVAGNTFSTNFPTRNPFQASFGGRIFDAFITKLNPAGSALVYSSYLGGGSMEECLGIAIDPAGNAYVTGYTFSTNFPTANAFQGTKVGSGTTNCDAFVTKVNANGALAFSTYLGGSNDDYGRRIAADAAGNCYFTGMTLSTNFPTANPLQAQHGGGTYDAYAGKFNANGSALVYSTYLGGSSYDEGLAIAVDGSGAAYITGATGSNNFPTASPIQGTFQGGTGDSQVRFTMGGTGIILFTVRTDTFALKLNGSGAALLYSTYLGGSGDDFGQALVLDGAGNAYVAGRTSSTNFPTANPLQAAFAGGGIFNNDAVITKIADGTSTIGTLASVSAASFLGAELAAESIVAGFGQNLATTTQVATSLPLPTELAGTTVKVRDSAGIVHLAGALNVASVERPAGLFFVAPTQVNYQIPPGTATGQATVTITSGSGAVSAGTVNIASVAPGLFSANASGQGAAAAVVFRRRADGSESFEPVAQFDQAQGRFVTVPIDLGPETDQVFLILYGVGFRFRSSLSAATVTIGGVNSEVLFADAAPGFVGLDQANVRLSRSLIGRGEVDVVLMVDGKAANTVKIAFR
jgi:uncharacterized protein (TIGR03437 family)